MNLSHSALNDCNAFSCSEGANFLYTCFWCVVDASRVMEVSSGSDRAAGKCFQNASSFNTLLMSCICEITKFSGTLHTTAVNSLLFLLFDFRNVLLPIPSPFSVLLCFK
eukprot:GDKK01020107.1.p3 GENE.GDKK01020107.1~~GDKK01020107.1.p3  ORF type:complete len:109 (-),score=11.54 GDKK01020107.1:759-1085(-)